MTGLQRAAILASTLMALLSSCASRPPAPEAPARSLATPAAPASSVAVNAAAGPATINRGPPEAARRLDYLDAFLADYWREKLPSGAVLAIKRQAGRKTAAARILLARDEGREAKPSEAGYEALALSTAVRSAAGSEPNNVGRSASEAGATVELRLEDYEDVALEILCPDDGMPALLDRIARALASPAFASEDFDLELREARLAERREAGDPLLRASTELRAELYPDLPNGLPARGTTASLAAATREGIVRYWSSHFDPRRLVIVVVGDFDPKDLAAELRSSFGAIANGSPLSVEGEASRGDPLRTTAPGLYVRPWFKALALSSLPGQALLRGIFDAPQVSSPDYPAMAVALAMLDDLLLEALRGDKSLAYGAWTSLSAAAAPTSLTVYKTSDPASAKAAVDAAIATLAVGLCVDLATGHLGPITRSLEAYKSRAITSLYAKSASSEGMAARIARDLASGGDGTAPFGLARRIADVRADDVVRVTRQWLFEGHSAWLALGDPDIVLGLSPRAFVPGR